MVLYYDLKVLKIFEYTKDFPREYKYTLGMKRDSVQDSGFVDRGN